MSRIDNHGNPSLQVRFFDLERFLTDDNHGSRCPACKDGVLTMHRDTETLLLLAVDLCTLCGQRVIYLDIERVRRERP